MSSPEEANSFILIDLFQKRFGVHESEQEVTKVVSLVQNCRISAKISNP